MENEFEHRLIPLASIKSGKETTVSPTVHGYLDRIVNIFFIENPDTKEWVLVDAGVPDTAGNIKQAAAELFGEGATPACIILTHGHFDHVGSIVELVKEWNVPVYAHELELPYLTGQLDYPEGNTNAGGGLITKMSKTFPNAGIDLSRHVRLIPLDHQVPHLPGWQWIHTPGHTPGHISLFQPEDKVLIAGDAFTTVQQESLHKVLTQHKEFNGPPRYFTMDEQEAYRSIRKLKDLHPKAAGTGHGMPAFLEELEEGLKKLTEANE
ncbi:MBL fold metallo-hydrolase [Terribacillus sp. 7520-G]|uniref:MBL fold metallo-hydrolase n=1 Tax=Terribacillus TaxID=459532 RepID=UPI000BA5A426|nr:MBL fold metallo-hydrolase [Terribacillus sp. 7520-G]PAD38746.1 MBL fold metallo-hydrolase [Terribacillus sp. 7520-G]